MATSAAIACSSDDASVGADCSVWDSSVNEGRTEFGCGSSVSSSKFNRLSSALDGQLSRGIARCGVRPIDTQNPGGVGLTADLTIAHCLPTPAFCRPALQRQARER